MNLNFNDVNHVNNWPEPEEQGPYIVDTSTGYEATSYTYEVPLEEVSWLLSKFPEIDFEPFLDTKTYLDTVESFEFVINGQYTIFNDGSKKIYNAASIIITPATVEVDQVLIDLSKVNGTLGSGSDEMPLSYRVLLFI
jgi:hypothetical protein